MAKAAPKTKAPAPKNPSLKLVNFTPAAIADTIALTNSKKSGSLLRVPVDQIVFMPGFNLRIDNEAYRAGIEELANSIEMEGYYDSHPLSCFAGELDGVAKVIVIDGHRRKMAVDLLNSRGANIETMPVVLKKPTSTDLDLAVSLDKENNAVQLTMLERAVLALRMLKSGMDRDEIAERLGKTKRHVDDLLVLIEAPKPVRDLVRDGTVAAYTAIAKMRREGGAEKIVELAAKTEAKAAEKGQKAAKLTKTTLENEGVKKPRLQVHRLNFKAEDGAPFLYEDVEPFLGLIGDEDWFKPARKKAERIALTDMVVDVTIRRPKTEEDEADEADETPVRGRRKTAVVVEAVTEIDPMEDDAEFEGEADDDETPNLRELDIADPADAGL